MTDITSVRIPKELKKRINQRYPSLDFSKSFCKLGWGFFKLEERLERKDEKLEKQAKTIELIRQSYSERGCSYLGSDSKGKPKCNNKKAPVHTDNLEASQCKICLETMKVLMPKLYAIATKSLPRWTTSMEKTQKEEQMNPEQPKEQFSRELDRIYCPHKEEWIDKSRCNLCKRLRWNTWQNCQEIRRRNPNDPMFQPKQNVVN